MRVKPGLPMLNPAPRNARHAALAATADYVKLFARSELFREEHLAMTPTNMLLTMNYVSAADFAPGPVPPVSGIW